MQMEQKQMPDRVSWSLAGRRGVQQLARVFTDSNGGFVIVTCTSNSR